MNSLPNRHAAPPSDNPGFQVPDPRGELPADSWRTWRAQLASVLLLGALVDRRERKTKPGEALAHLKAVLDAKAGEPADAPPEEALPSRERQRALRALEVVPTAFWRQVDAVRGATSPPREAHLISGLVLRGGAHRVPYAKLLRVAAAEPDAKAAKWKLYATLGTVNWAGGRDAGTRSENGRPSSYRFDPSVSVPAYLEGAALLAARLGGRCEDPCCREKRAPEGKGKFCRRHEDARDPEQRARTRQKKLDALFDTAGPFIIEACARALARTEAPESSLEARPWSCEEREAWLAKTEFPVQLGHGAEAFDQWRASAEGRRELRLEERRRREAARRGSRSEGRAPVAVPKELHGLLRWPG